MKLHEWQQASIAAYFDYGGAFIAMPVGAGKSTVAAEIARRCEKPCVLAPARGILQLEEMFANAPDAVFKSHTAMCRAAADGWLEENAFSDVIIDEAHMLKNISTNTAARRLNRYLVENPAVRVCWITGTPIARSLGDAVHGLRFALRKRAPLPSTREGIRRLVAQVDGSEQAQLLFFDQLKNTPGVFIDTAPSYDGEIQLTVVHRDAVLPLDEDAAYWERGPAAWGVKYRVDPPFSDAFRAARREWNATVQYLIDARSCDTEEQARSVRPELYAKYRAVADAEPDYQQVVEWADDSALRQVLTDVQPGTLVWAHHRAVQEKAAEILGCAREPGGPIAVLSMKSHSTVLNLQQYHTNIVLEMLPEADLMNQLIGRTARQGQRSPVVRVDLVCAGQHARKTLARAVFRANLIRNTTGTSNPLCRLTPKEIRA